MKLLTSLKSSFASSYHLRAHIYRVEGAAALVTTSTDEKFYSNGLDLESLMKDAPGLLREFYSLLSRTLNLPMATIAAVNGHCIAGGGKLALTCSLLTNASALCHVPRHYIDAR